MECYRAPAGSRCIELSAFVIFTISVLFFCSEGKVGHSAIRQNTLIHSDAGHLPECLEELQRTNVYILQKPCPHQGHPQQLHFQQGFHRQSQPHNHAINQPCQQRLHATTATLRNSSPPTTRPNLMQPSAATKFRPQK